MVLSDGDSLLTEEDHHHEIQDSLLQDGQDLTIINLEMESNVINHNHQRHQREGCHQQIFHDVLAFSTKRTCED